MSLQEQISADLHAAMKRRETERVSALRILVGEFQRQPDKELDDARVLAIIRKLSKAEQELLAAGGQHTSAFIDILEEYLPRAAGEEEIRSWIAANIDFSTLNSRMQAMKPIMAHFGGRADGNTVQRILAAFPD